MCEKRITNLRRLLVKSNRPIQSVLPEVLVTKNNEESVTTEGKQEIKERLDNGVEDSVSSIYFIICSECLLFVLK